MKQKDSANKKPRRSLRTLLMLWLLAFSVTPLTYLTGYSLVKYEQAIDQELSQRLRDDHREVQVIFQEFQNDLQLRNRQHAHDKTLAYYLSVNNTNAIHELASKWMKGQFTNRLTVSNREGRLVAALSQNAKGEIARQEKLETGEVSFSKDFLEKANERQDQEFIDFSRGGTIDLVAFSQVLAANDNLVGYLEEVLTIDSGFVTALKNRMNLEVVFVSEDGAQAVASHEDLAHYRLGFYTDRYSEAKNGLFDLNIRGVPYGFMIQPVKWGDHKFYVAIGASKQAAKQVLKNVNVAFFGMVGAIIILLTILSFIISKVLLQPLNELVEVVQTTDFDKQPALLTRRSDTELGILTSAFNDLIQRVYTAQKELRDNIKKLEDANAEIRDTQAKLVHTARMASLGQLVAGVAHELNNPIGFIYSNMAHLRDYAQRLIDLVRTAEKHPEKFEKEKIDKEFNYVVEDMPKLIKSCEEGARRTRDIVLGLRNFSRLDEAKTKEVDIHEGIESTLALLAGEFKSRIKVVKNYGKLPLVNCYPSQLNQVFMNILSNAGQAIKDQGEITITTKLLNPKEIEVSIRDDGMGMSDETREKIFDPFFTTKEDKGTGLGMSIAYGVIEKHRGKIQVNSKLKAGTEFIITLPTSVSG